MNGPRVPDFSQMTMTTKPNIDILEIRNKFTKECIPYSTIDYLKTNHEYSSKKTDAIWCMLIDGEHVSKHKPYIIKYTCNACNSVVDIGITQFLRKIQKNNVTRCRYCVNKDEIKRLSHSELLKNNPCTRYWEKPAEVLENRNLSILEQKELYEKTFHEEFDSDSQQSYFTYHLTVDEYTHVKKHIISMNNGRVTKDAFNKFEYFPIWKCPNQMKYTCVLYDPNRNTIEKPQQIQCKCETCDQVFSIKSLHSLKNKYKVLCKYCSLCRNTFKRRAMMNINNEKVIVQSKLEIKFVTWCNSNNILVVNGPKLDYVWNDKTHTYYVDFEIPKLQWMIETKDMHIWHQEQTLNGKWYAKKNTALQKVSDGEYKRFVEIYPKNWMRITDLILSKLRKEDIV